MKSRISIFLFLLLFTVSSFAQNIFKNATVSPLNELKKNYFEGKYKEGLMAYLHYGNDLNAEEAYYLGMTNAALFNYDAALDYLQQAVKKDSADTGYEYQLAKINLLVGRTQAAEKNFTHLLSRAPSYLPALFDAGVLDFTQKRYTEAVRKFKAVTKLTPANFLAFYNLAKAYSCMEPADAYRDSVSIYLSTAVSINSDYLPAVEMLGTWYFNNKIYDQALQQFQIAAAKNPSRSDFFYLAGMCWEKEGKYEKAVDLLTQAIEINGKEAHYWDHLGFCQYSLEQYLYAIAAYKEAIKIDGENSSFNVNLAYAYLKTDSTELAIESFETAVGKMRPEEIGKIYCQKGHTYYSKQEYAKAREEYRTALVYDPVNIDAYYLCAVCDDKLNNKPLALAGYKKALELISAGMTKTELEKNERYNTIRQLVSILTRRTKKGKQ